MVVIRSWFEREPRPGLGGETGHSRFRARIVLPGEGPQNEIDRVIVTDSVDWLCDSLKAFFAERVAQAEHRAS